jgi:hypothetical protein
MAIYKLVRRFDDGREEPLPFEVLGGWYSKIGMGIRIDDESWVVTEILEHPPTFVATKQEVS